MLKINPKMVGKLFFQKKFETVHDKYFTHRKDKYFQLKSPSSSCKEAIEERRSARKMMTITVTRQVGPEFKVYLPDDVS